MTDAAAPLDAAGLARALRRAAEEGRAAVSPHLVDNGRGEPTSSRALLGLPEGDLLGSLGDPALDREALTSARALLADRTARPGTVEIPLEGGTARVYLELHLPPETLVVVGAGHVAQPLAAVGALLGFQVVVLDDRPEWATEERFPEAARVERIAFDAPFSSTPIHDGTHVVLVTRGHKYDYACLLDLLRRERRPAYVGMIGSRRRIRATYAQLAGDGIAPEVAAEVRAPIGLDLGAQTPAEIAVAVAAELVQFRRGGSGRPLTDLERVAERFMAHDGDALTGEEKP